MIIILIVSLIIALSLILAKYDKYIFANKSKHITAGTSGVYDAETLQRIETKGERFSIFAIIKLKSWDEYDKFVEICKPNYIVLHMALTSDTFWYWWKKERLNYINFPLYCIVEKDGYGIRGGYVNISWCDADEEFKDEEKIKYRDELFINYKIYGISLNEFENKLKSKSAVVLQ